MTFTKLYIAGSFLMLGVLFYCGRLYGLRRWKILLTTPVLALSGALGITLMSFVESGRWGGRSFFGAVFFVPPAMALFARLIRERPGDIVDICMPGGCLMLGIQKIQCYMAGCCYGIVIGYDAAGRELRFPSQITESVTGFALTALLLLMIRNGRQRGRICPWFYLFYGISRFLLNLLRDTKPDIWILPYGNIWSLLCILIALIWFSAARRKTKAAERKQQKRR